MKSRVTIVGEVFAALCILQAQSQAQSSTTTSEVLDLLGKPVDLEVEDQTLNQLCILLGERLRLPLILDKQELDELPFDQDQKLTLVAQGLPLHVGLALLLNEHDLGFAIRDGYLLISSIEVAELKQTTIVYDVTDLVDNEPAYQTPLIDIVYSPAEIRPLPTAYLIALINNSITPDMWQDVGTPVPLKATPRLVDILSS